MKNLLKIFYLIFLILILFFIFFIPEIKSLIFEDKKITIGAHRGSSIEFTENTIEAINDSLNDDIYKFIEFDLRITNDKKILVHHDDLLLRNHFSFKKISDLNYSEIVNYSNYHIPDLEEVLELISNRKKMIIEFKSTNNDSLDAEFIKETIFILNFYNISKNDVLLSSTNQDIINYIILNYPEYKTGIVFWILSFTYLDSEELIKEFYSNINSDYILLHNINLRNYENLIEFKPFNKTLLFWDFEDKIYMISDKEIFW